MAVIAIGVVACSSTPDADPGSFDVPDTAPFFSGVGNVSSVFELRCGSIDCHGTLSRPLRIYSTNGLRLPPPDTTDAGDMYVPGGIATTNSEVTANYQSIVALEPEQMRLVCQKDSTTSPTTLLILRKPMGIESHKGGTIFTAQSHEAACLIGWLSHKPSPDDCTAAVNDFPKPRAN